MAANSDTGESPHDGDEQSTEQTESVELELPTADVERIEFEIEQNSDAEYASESVEEWIEQHAPTAVLSGHIHQAPFTPDGDWVTRVGDTWLFNPGQQPGPVPAHVELDLTAGTASWRSYAGAHERVLEGIAG